MMQFNIKELSERLLESFKKHKYVLLVLLVGLVLLALPGENKKTDEKKTVSSDDSIGTGFSCEAVEQKLRDILSLIDGAGRVEIMLSVSGESERVVAVDTQHLADKDGGEDTGRKSTEETEKVVIISQGSGVDDAITLKYIYPEFTGAIVVCEGANNASVKLEITEAVSAITGLKASKIRVIKMQ